MVEVETGESCESGSDNSELVAGLTKQVELLKQQKAQLRSAIRQLRGELDSQRSSGMKVARRSLFITPYSKAFDQDLAASRHNTKHQRNFTAVCTERQSDDSTEFTDLNLEKRYTDDQTPSKKFDNIVN